MPTQPDSIESWSRSLLFPTLIPHIGWTSGLEGDQNFILGEWPNTGPQVTLALSQWTLSCLLSSPYPTLFSHSLPSQAWVTEKSAGGREVTTKSSTCAPSPISMLGPWPALLFQQAA
jgi:hypothetical protein